MNLENLKEKFIEEALGLINDLEAALLEHEESLNSIEHIHQIFRVMHTLKGVSSMYGYDHVSELAHDLETIIDRIRDGKLDLTNEIFEITLDTVDQFRSLLADVTMNDQTVKAKQVALLGRIGKIVEEIGLKKSSDTGIQNASLASEGMETFYIVFEPNDSMIFRGINIVYMFNDLAELGSYKIIKHSFDDGNNRNAWGIYLATDKGIGEIESIFMFVLDNCRIIKIADGNMFLKPSIDNPMEGESIAEMVDEKEVDAAIERENEIQEIDFENNTSSNDTPSDTNGAAFKVADKISVSAEKLDQLMHLVSELVSAKSELNLVAELDEENERLYSVAEKIDDISRQFRDNVLEIRLVSVAEMIIPFKRMVRDLSKNLGKEIQFITQGIETELDKNIINRLSEPIMHILRNCVDHGIELPDERESKGKTRQGLVKFTSFYSGTNVFIQIQDDGAGIDTAKVKSIAIEKGLVSAEDELSDKQIYELLFHPGFSTAEKVTDVSGRGVGMDVVRKKIQEVRGEVDIDSEPGLGTFFTIKLHQTMSIMDTLLVRVEDAKYMLPISDVISCEQELHSNIYKTQNKHIEINGSLIPFVSIHDLFDHESEYLNKERIVIINKNDRELAIVADEIIGEHQAVLKPLGNVFDSQRFLSGASVLGDGSLALMLDTNQLVNASL